MGSLWMSSRCGSKFNSAPGNLPKLASSILSDRRAEPEQCVRAYPGAFSCIGSFIPIREDGGEEEERRQKSVAAAVSVTLSLCLATRRSLNGRLLSTLRLLLLNQAHGNVPLDLNQTCAMAHFPTRQDHNSWQCLWAETARAQPVISDAPVALAQLSPHTWCFISVFCFLSLLFSVPVCECVFPLCFLPSSAQWECCLCALVFSPGVSLVKGQYCSMVLHASRSSESLFHDLLLL